MLTVPVNVRRQLQRALSRVRLVEFARTMAWVAPLTILIWVYAEREQIANVADVPVTLALHTASPSRIATFIRPGDRNLTIELEGPRVRLDTVRQALSAGPLVLDLDTSLPSGAVSRSTLELLNRLPLFRDNGVKVVSASPPEMNLNIDQIVSRELTVVADPTVASFETAPVFDPPTVRLTGPQSLLDRIPLNDATGRSPNPTPGQVPGQVADRAVVRPDFRRAAQLVTPGIHEMSDVPLIKPLPPNLDESAAALITLSPERVKATFRIRQADVSYVVPAMPVFPLAPANLLDDYRPVFEPVVTNVTVLGRPELIAQLRAGTLPTKPKAVLEFTRDDIPAAGPPGSTRTFTRPLRFDLPDGLTVSPDDQKRQVELTLTPRPRPE